MKKIAMIFLIGLVIFSFIYPVFVLNDFNYFFSLTLVLILGISIFAEYFFGMTYQMLLQADQKQYVLMVIQIFTTILNTVFSVVLIKCGCGIHVIKIATAIVFCLNPLLITIYVKKKYRIEHNAPVDNNLISQRWDAFFHQLASFVQNNSSTIIITIFLNLTEVSVFSVYYMILHGIRKLFLSISTALESAFGKIIYSFDGENIYKIFVFFEKTILFFCIFVFACTQPLFISFVNIYTKGLTDAEYVRPLFGVLFTISEFLYCSRIPYTIAIQSIGKYKETKKIAIIEAISSLVISCALINFVGIYAIPIAFIVSACIRNAYYIFYAYKNVLKKSIVLGYCKYLFAVGIFGFISFILLQKSVICNDYFSWIKFAIFTSIITVCLTAILYVVPNFKTIITFLKISKSEKRHANSNE